MNAQELADRLYRQVWDRSRRRGQDCERTVMTSAKTGVSLHLHIDTAVPLRRTYSQGPAHIRNAHIHPQPRNRP